MNAGLVAAMLLLPGVALADMQNGVQLPDGAVKVGENRYRVKEDWDGIQKYYKLVYSQAQYPRKQIVSQPGVKAIHITNPSGKNWEGMNIYSTGDDTGYFVITPQATAKPPAKKPDAAKKK